MPIRAIRGGEKGILARPGRFLGLVGLLLIALPGSAGAATITPSIDGDDTLANSDCSLREAITSINNAILEQSCTKTGNFGDNDTVQLLAGHMYTLSVSLNNDNINAGGDLDVLVENVTIAGNEDNPPTIMETAGDTDRVLHAPNQKNLTLRDLVITDGGLTSGGTPQFGGNIFYNGDTGKTLLLDNVDVTSGVADTNNSGDAGGGIFVTGGGQVTIQDSLISGNRAGPSTGGFFQGGGIAVFGDSTDVTVTNSTISNNSSGVGDMTAAPADGSGGGIYLGVNFGTGGVHTFNNATIDSNHAGGGAANVIGDGGGIEVTSGQSFTFTGGAISNNTAGGTGADAQGDGGGLFLANTGGSPTLTNANITDNKAGGDGGNGQGYGGGIKVNATMAATPTDLAVVGGQVSGNQAGIGTGVVAAQGGGIQFFATSAAPNSDLTLSGTQVSNNSALMTGGGVYMRTDTGALTIADTTVNGNTAGDGGGLWREVTSAATDTILRSTFNGNTGGQGGGMGIFANETMNITESTISNNHATSDAGSGLHEGGGIYTGSNLTLTNSTVHGNDANATSGKGGGIRSGTAPTVTLNHTTVAQNSATGAGSAGGNLYLEGGAGTGVIRASIVAGGTAADASTSNCFQQIPGMTITSSNFNVESPTDQCNFVAGNDLAPAANLFLGTLGNNGGPTQTVPLLAGSPAIDRVTSPCTGSPATDQRGAGFVRRFPAAGACDSGAYELQDLDGDGILDTSDNCPTQAGPASNVGCPLPVVNPPAVTPTTPTTPTAAPKKKCKKKKKGAAAAKKCKKKK